MEIADSGAASFLFPADAAEGMAPRSWSVIVSVVGQAAVVDRHARELRRLAGEANAAEFQALSESESVPLLTRIREFPRLVLDLAPSAMIFRVNLVPSAIPSVLQKFQEVASRAGFDLATLTKASGILYAAFSPPKEVEASPAAGAQLAKEVLQLNAAPEANVQSMLEWCPAESKRLIGDVWGSPRADISLMRKIKNAFDPQGVLSPGRFAGGI